MNAALLEVTQRRSRLRALDRLVEIGKDGAYDIDLLLDKKNYR